MLHQRIIGDLESGSIVTLPAAIAPRIACELAVVLVFVAVRAFREFDFELRRLLGRNMT